MTRRCLSKGRIGFQGFSSLSIFFQVEYRERGRCVVGGISSRIVIISKESRECRGLKSSLSSSSSSDFSFSDRSPPGTFPLPLLSTFLVLLVGNTFQRRVTATIQGIPISL